jgi:hypothetical protein
VSTILKALKKLEREKEAALRAAGPIPVAGATGPARSGPSGWPLKPWLLWSMAGVIIVVLGGTTWHFYRQSRAYTPRLAERSGTLEPQPQPARRPTVAAKPASPPPNRDVIRAEPRPSDRSTPAVQLPSVRQPADDQAHSRKINALERPRQSAGSPVSRVSRPRPARELPADGQTSPAVTPAMRADRTRRRPVAERNPIVESPAPAENEQDESASADSTAKPDAESYTQAPTDDYEKTPLLTDGSLRVHAIAWSPQPAERMAVINSRVIHEGDSVEDFTVMVIRPDDVVVREKGKGVWRVEFGRP